MVHSSVELKTNSQGEFSYPVLLKYLYSGVNWIAVIVQIEENLFTPQPFLGINGSDVADGVNIAGIVTKASAAKAGLKPDDIITAFDETKITDMKSLKENINKHSVGDEIKLKILRDKEEVAVIVQLGSSPEGQKELWIKYAFDRLLNKEEKRSSREAKLKNGATLRLDFLAE